MQITQTLYIRADEKWDGTITYNLVTADMSEYGWMMVGTHDVTFDVPAHDDLRVIKAKAIEKEMENVRAAFHARITELQRTYNELLAIEGA